MLRLSASTHRSGQADNINHIKKNWLTIFSRVGASLTHVPTSSIRMIISSSLNPKDSDGVKYNGSQHPRLSDID